MNNKTASEYVKVSSKGLEKLVKDVIQLKQFLSKVWIYMSESINIVRHLCVTIKIEIQSVKM